MRKTLTLLLALLAAISAKAEGLWGVKASFDINVPTKWKAGDLTTKMYDSGLGFSLGGVCSHYFTDGFYLEPSLSIFYDTYSCDIVFEEDAAASSGPAVYKVGLRLPVVIGYTFDLTDDFAISVFTGPELDYAFAGGYRYKDKAFEGALGPLFGGDGTQRPLSCSWKGGIAFPFSDWRVDFEAAIGLTDIIRSPASCKENRVSLSLLRYF